MTGVSTVGRLYGHFPVEITGRISDNTKGSEGILPAAKRKKKRAEYDA